MKPASFRYERPASLAAALQLLAENEGARPIAGGQSLGPMLNLRAATPELLIDIARLTELKRIESDGEAIIVGAGVRHADIEDGGVPDVLDGLLARVARGIAYRAVRNRGTIGGSLAHADPAADWPSIMIALGATIHVRSAKGARTIAAADLVTGARAVPAPHAPRILPPRGSGGDGAPGGHGQAAAAGSGPHRLPHRPGGPDQRDQARRYR